jgi:hypothetical protein
MSTAKTASSTNETSGELSRQVGKKPRRAIRAGKHAGLTAVTISKLMGCSTWTAKKYLYKLKPIDLDDIGQLVHNYRSEKERKRLGTLLDWNINFG